MNKHITNNGIHIVRVKVRARIGAIIKIDIDDVNSYNGSLMTSLMALTMG